MPHLPCAIDVTMPAAGAHAGYGAELILIGPPRRKGKRLRRTALCVLHKSR